MQTTITDLLFHEYKESAIDRLMTAVREGEHAMHAVAENSGADFQNRAYDLARMFFQKAQRATGEDATIVWTPEIRSAWAAAEPIVLEAKDKIGARKAFIAAYERIVERARSQSEPVKWEVSLGHDADAREQALALSARLNRISSASANAMIEMVRPLALPSPENGGMEVLAHIRKAREALAMDRAKREAEKQALADEQAAKVGPATANLLRAGELLKARQTA